MKEEHLKEKQLQNQRIVGRNIAQMRKLNDGMTQIELAVRASLTEITIIRYENGDNSQDLFKMASIAKVLHCTVDDLLIGVEQDEDIEQKEGIRGAIIKEQLKHFIEKCPLLNEACFEKCENEKCAIKI
ncbi:MAG: helix-turn-helix transcriptional regulator [Bacteroidota bacterium]